MHSLGATSVPQIADLPETLVDMPEWGGLVRIRAMTKGQHQTIRRRALHGDELDLDRLEMELLRACVVEPPADEALLATLRDMSVESVDRLLAAICEINGITEEAARTSERSFRNRY